MLLTLAPQKTTNFVQLTNCSRFVTLDYKPSNKTFTQAHFFLIEKYEFVRLHSANKKNK